LAGLDHGEGDEGMAILVEIQLERSWDVGAKFFCWDGIG